MIDQKEVRHLIRQNKKIKAKILEQAQAYKEEKARLKSINRALQASLEEEQQRNRETIEEFNEKILELEMELKRARSNEPIATNYTTPQTRPINPISFVQLEAENQRLIEETNRIMQKHQNPIPKSKFSYVPQNMKNSTSPNYSSYQPSMQSNVTIPRYQQINFSALQNNQIQKEQYQMPPPMNENIQQQENTSQNQQQIKPKPNLQSNKQENFIHQNNQFNSKRPIQSYEIEEEEEYQDDTPPPTIVNKPPPQNSSSMTNPNESLNKASQQVSANKVNNSQLNQSKEQITHKSSQHNSVIVSENDNQISKQNNSPKQQKISTETPAIINDSTDNSGDPFADNSNIDGFDQVNLDEDSKHEKELQPFTETKQEKLESPKPTTLQNTKDDKSSSLMDGISFNQDAFDLDLGAEFDKPLDLDKSNVNASKGNNSKVENKTVKKEASQQQTDQDDNLNIPSAGSWSFPTSQIQIDLD